MGSRMALYGDAVQSKVRVTKFMKILADRLELFQLVQQLV